MPTADNSSGQTYRGIPAEARRAARRARLIQAAIATYAQTGFQSATVKAVCEAAGLTERYFYESFTNSQALLAAVCESVTAEVVGCVKDNAAAVPQHGPQRVRHVLNCYFNALEEDRARSRVFLVEVAGSGGAAASILSVAHGELVDLLEEAWGAGAASSDTILKAGVAGGLARMATVWVSSEGGRPRDEFVNAAMRLAATLQI